MFSKKFAKAAKFTQRSKDIPDNSRCYEVTFYSAKLRTGLYSMRRKKTALNKNHYFQYISIFFYEIFREIILDANCHYCCEFYHLNCCSLNRAIKDDFTVRRSALHGLCDSNSVCLSVRQSVRLSVTLVDCVHTVRPTIMISSPYGSPFILVSEDITLIPKFEGGHPERGR